MKEKERKYATPTAFRRALEDRLKAIAVKEKSDFQRLCREVAFDRLLARLFARPEPPWILKGGYAMELRLKEARVTKDIDLNLRRSLKGSGIPFNEAIQQTLKEAADKDMNDFFSFTVGAATADLDAAPYGGARFPVEARMDGRTFVRFHVDVAAGDVELTPSETLEGRDWMDFAGIAAVKVTAIPREQQFAEKLHAYTLPRKKPNSRVRDLVDMILLIKSGGMSKARVSGAIQATFGRRKTHPVPNKLDAPSRDWERPFAEMAKECSLIEDLDAAFKVLDEYFRKLG